jgi:diguanylate cyclase (GGDEF)-like protein
MLSSWSATEVAFLMVAIIQGVFAVIWALGAWLVPSTRSAALHWATWSTLSAVLWLVLVAQIDSPPLVGVLAGVVGVIILQRGIRLFIGRDPTLLIHIPLLMTIFFAAWIGSSPTSRPWQAVLNFGVLCVLYGAIARDLYLHARDQLRFRQPWLLGLPVLLGCIGYGSRAVRALLEPASVLALMTTDSSLNVGAALTFVVLVLALHATLVVLVVGRLVAELRRLSHYDGLTSLFNRRAMEEMLDAQMHRSRRGNDSFAVMMMDLDHFKRINDQHGHAVGDLALKHVSALLLGAMRDSDKLARFGGEEFVVLMADTTLDQAQPAADQLRELIASHPLHHFEIRVPISVSIGVAQWLGTNEDSSHLLSRADAALFQAKVMGRNRVVRAVGGAVSDSGLTPLLNNR